MRFKSRLLIRKASPFNYYGRAWINQDGEQGVEPSKHHEDHAEAGGYRNNEAMIQDGWYRVGFTVLGSDPYCYIQGDSRHLTDPLLRNLQGWVKAHKRGNETVMIEFMDARSRGGVMDLPEFLSCSRYELYRALNSSHA